MVGSRLRRTIRPVIHRATKGRAQERALIEVARRVPSSAHLIAKVFPQPEAFAASEERLVTRHGASWVLRPAHYCEWHHYLGIPDPVLELLVQLVRPDEWAIDVGANVGIYALALARRARPAGVLAVEAHPRTFARLEQHLRMNADAPVVAVNCAVGDAPGTITLFESIRGDSGLSSLLPQPEMTPAAEVELRRLDDVAKDLLAAAPVGLVKIDVEGFEPEVILGASALLEEHRPHLALELTPGWASEGGANLDAALGLLERLGYRFYRVVGRTGVELIRVPDPRTLPRTAQYNLLATHPVRRASLGSLVGP